MFDLFFRKKQKVALVLGGGGARGIAHLGVLKFFEERGYKFDFIVGTSAGGVFGAFYLKYLDVSKAWVELKEEVYKRKEISENLSKIVENNEKISLLSKFREKLYEARILFKEGILENDLLKESYGIMFKNLKYIKDLKGKIFIVATDLLTGKDVVFSQGELLPALMATSALPGIFPPVDYKGFYLIDGGSTQKLPTIIAKKLGADKVLAVDVGSNLNKREKHHPTGAKIIIRIEDVVSYRLHLTNVKHADLLIRPNIEKFKWYDFNKYEEIFELGYKAATNIDNKIKEFFKSSKAKPICSCCSEDFILI